MKMGLSDMTSGIFIVSQGSFVTYNHGFSLVFGVERVF